MGRAMIVPLHSRLSFHAEAWRAPTAAGMALKTPASLLFGTGSLVWGASCVLGAIPRVAVRTYGRGVAATWLAGRSEGL